MSVYYATFGIGTENKGYVQPIYTESEELALEIMKNTYNNNYAHLYNKTDGLYLINKYDYKKMAPIIASN